MAAKRFLLTGLLVMFVYSLAYSEGDSSKPGKPKEDLAKNLKEIEAKIRRKRKDPMLYYRKAQCLMKLARYNEGHDVAKKAMELFIKKKNKLAWMLLESVDLGGVKVDVHFNMGPRERKYPEMGIVRPLSFRIWKKEKDPELLEIIDFEISVFKGKLMTAALGQTTGRRHASFEMLETDTKYEDIRKKAIALIERRHPKPKEAKAPEKKK